MFSNLLTVMPLFMHVLMCMLHFARKLSAPSYFHNIHLFFLSTEGISSPAPYSARFHKVDWSIKLVE
jgi:hypothetical protein